LVYLSGYTHSDLEAMTYLELDKLLERFVEQRRVEKEQAQQGK